MAIEVLQRRRQDFQVELARGQQRFQHAVALGIVQQYLDALVVQSPRRQAGPVPAFEPLRVMRAGQAHAGRQSRLAAQFGEAAGHLQAAAGENRSAVDVRLDAGQHMGAKDDPGALAAQAVEQLVELDGGQRVEAHRRFVEQQQARFAEQRLGQAEALAHALRVGFQAPPGGMAEADLFQQARGFGRRHALEAGEVAQGFRAAELRVEGHVLRQVAELAARLQAPRIVAEDPHAAFAGGQQAEDQLDGGGLAGAVVAEQAEHLAGLQAQVEPAQGGEGAVAQGRAVDLDQAHGLGPAAGIRISGWLSRTPGERTTGKARWTQRSSSMLGLFNSRRTCGYSQISRSTLSLGS